MSVHIRIVISAVALLFSFFTIELVRRRRLRPEYAVVWAVLSGMTILMVIFPKIFVWMVWLTGMAYQSSVILFVFVFVALMFMSHSIIASRHGSRITRLTQEIGLLRAEIEQLRSERGKSGETA